MTHYTIPWDAFTLTDSVTGKLVLESLDVDEGNHLKGFLAVIQPADDLPADTRQMLVHLIELAPDLFFLLQRIVAADTQLHTLREYAERLLAQIGQPE